MKESEGVGVVTLRAATMRYGLPSTGGAGSLFNRYRILYHKIHQPRNLWRHVGPAGIETPLLFSLKHCSRAFIPRAGAL